MPKRLMFEEIKKYIEKEKYILLSTEYSGAHIKIQIQCSIGHIYNVSWANFQKGRRCPKCSKKTDKQIKDIKEYIESFGYKLLLDRYKNAYTKITLQCPKGHIYDVRYNSFQQGTRCPECFGNKKHTLEKVSNYIKNTGYSLLSKEYKNTGKKLIIKCENNHRFLMTFGDFQQGHRCPECASVKGWSKPEKEIAEYVKQNYIGNIIENDRTICKNFWTGKNLELDVWLPELNKAIEFNGTYWHSINNAKWRDEMKKKQCSKKGIDLLVIQEQDWYDNKEKCLLQINNFT